jgi:DNA ligase-4
MKCLSFVKVGGGFKLDDYKKIEYLTEGKWTDWDSKKPPTEYIQLGGVDEQKERPDQWIKPCDSVVLQVKAASAGPSSEFATRITLRFPRFQRLREDKKWDDALDINDFFALKEEAEESKKKKFKLEASRKRAKRQKQELVIAGSETVVTPYAGPKTKVFEGLNFCVRSEMVHPKKKKAEIEQIITSNGGKIFQSPNAEGGNLLCIGDKNVVPVASLVKEGKTNIIRPAWILDTLKQAEIDGPQRSNFLLPIEPAHIFHCLGEQREEIDSNVDIYKDSYAKDITPEDLKRLTDDMIHPKNSEFDPTQFLTELEERGKGLGEMPGEMFRRCVVRFVGAGVDDAPEGIDLFLAKNRVKFAGGKLAEDNDDQRITHVVFVGGDTAVIKNLRQKLSQRGGKVPRIVEMKWLEESWSEKTLLDEERYPVSA